MTVQELKELLKNAKDNDIVVFENYEKSVRRLFSHPTGKYLLENDAIFIFAENRK